MLNKKILSLLITLCFFATTSQANTQNLGEKNKAEETGVVVILCSPFPYCKDRT
ncbi:hypothetical protein L1285_04385 [Pseudoalteromonas sp. DL2-H2.2]|uniref:hypothetical protein n=1 Tax=Pseudoalteromonas TaxID=53246 RepID=UPI000AB30E59|nr:MULTISPECIES: hypothetical protein [Pseudoalteromonas]MCF2907555.1 hypothetical protein [Pseudoalteromonas sp. DL2-H2.2]